MNIILKLICIITNVLNDILHCWFDFAEDAGLTGPDDVMFDDQCERVSSTRRAGEDDMAYYERRYQERVLDHCSPHNVVFVASSQA